MKPIYLSIIAGVVIYILFAACYGLMPITWGEAQKAMFIAIEVILPGMMLFILTMNAQDDKKLDRLSEDIDKAIETLKDKQK